MDLCDDSIDSIEIANSDDELPAEALEISDDDSDYDENIEENDDYNSESSEASFVGQEIREEAAENEEVLICSKDRTIQYSTFPPPPARPPVQTFSHGKICTKCLQSIRTKIIHVSFFFFTQRAHSVHQSTNR